MFGVHRAPHRPTVLTGYAAVWMSGQSEASFLIQDSRRAQQLRNKTVAERVEKLYSVQIRLTARVAAAGSQDQGQGEWVTVTANGSGDTEKAKVRLKATFQIPVRVHAMSCCFMHDL